MPTYRKLVKLLPPGDIVYSLTESGRIEPVTVLKVCDGWLKTSSGILDFDDHGCTWWLTKSVALEKNKHVT